MAWEAFMRGDEVGYRGAWLTSVKDVFEWCHANCREVGRNLSAAAQLARRQLATHTITARDFILVGAGDIKRADCMDADPLVGSSRLHSFEFRGEVGVDRVTTRRLTCFCFGCSRGAYAECAYPDVVDVLGPPIALREKAKGADKAQRAQWADRRVVLCDQLVVGMDVVALPVGWAAGVGWGAEVDHPDAAAAALLLLG
jgi:hypothetical protein